MSDLKTTPTFLYDRTECQTMIVLGQLGTTLDADDVLLFRYENDAPEQVRDIAYRALREDDRYVALCRHHYTANDSCPGCDYDQDDLGARVAEYGMSVSVRTFSGHTIDLGSIYQDADTTWVAMVPHGLIIGTGIVSADSAVRALTLDHKRRVWFTAANDNVLYDARRASTTDEITETATLVRRLTNLGVATAEQFVALVEQATPKRIRIDELITGPADVWARPADQPEEPWFRTGSVLTELERTHPVVTSTDDGSAL